jgi:hypothetical protein
MTMALPTPARFARGRVLALALVGLAGLLFFPVTAGANTITSITSVGQTVEITMQSGAGFDVRDELVLLIIGDQQFTTSRSPDDGSLNQLTFILTLDEWNQLATGDPVIVQFGEDDDNPQSFGTLDKSLLNK